MDSLLSKMGPLKALVPAKAGRRSESSDASQMQTQSRSVQVSVCRSPSSQAKPAAAVISSAPPAQETSLDPPFNALPLPSSRTSVPAPLRFLWFNRKKRASTEIRAPEQEHALHLSAFNDEDMTSRLILADGIAGEANYMGEFVERNDVRKEDTGNVALQKARTDTGGTKQDLLNDSEIATSILSDAILTNVDPSCKSTKKSWISAITDLRGLWPTRKMQTNQAGSSGVSTISSAPDDCGIASTDKQGSCCGCELNVSDGCSLEVPYTKVLHSRASFSKFLQDASLFDMKVLGQMSFLCDTAYMIPDIQPGQLLKHHHLKYITSSLDKKVEAEAKAKEAELSKMVLRNGKDKLATNGDLHGGSSNGGNESAEARKASTQDLSEVHISGHNEESTPTAQELLMTVAPVTAVVLAEEETKQAVAKELQTKGSCPCEWFVCDDDSTHTRFFVIQGSESLASWQTNLLFEPTKFEGLDVLVHRGIYEAANALYEQVLPEVLAYFSAHGDRTQIRLTGHSLGGSLATLLALMFQIRGVLPRKSILPVVTFGAPCIMCGGDYLLRKMDLPIDHIQSIIMHRDVVPRAFSCDYPDHIAQILKSLNGKFRDHPCLNNQKLLFAPMGQLLILQPDERTAPSHPLLPGGHGLYLLRHPTNDQGVETEQELRAAQRAFLNMPHPLEILSDRGAYGLNGAVSRDHNPRSYANVVHMVLRTEAKRLRRVQREQRRQLMWPLVLTETSLVARRRLGPSTNLDQVSFNGGLFSAVSRTSMFFKQPKSFCNYGTFGRIRFAVGGSSTWESQKAAFSRYARLIASKHVQMGMLFIVSFRVVVLECLSTLHALI